MMIRINLLPVRQGKRREAGRQILVVIAGGNIAALAVNYGWYANREGERQTRQKRIDATQARINELEKVIGEVNNINKRKKEVEEKLKALNDLRKQRSGPVRLMDALANSVPRKVAIKEFDEKANSVKIAGIASTHDDVAEMMRQLAGVVWTPKGMGRLIEKKRDASTSRIELIGEGAGVVEDFPNTEVSSFFSSIDLKKASQRDEKSGTTNIRLVDFELALTANYAT